MQISSLVEPIICSRGAGSNKGLRVLLRDTLTPSWLGQESYLGQSGTKKFAGLVHFEQNDLNHEPSL